MKKTLLAAVLAVCLLFSACSVGTPVANTTAPTESPAGYRAVTVVDHCVLEPDDRERLSDRDKEAYTTLMEGMLTRADSVTLDTDSATPDELLELLRESPYYFFLSGAEVRGNDVHFTYAYTPEKQSGILAFMDDEFLRIANHEAALEDNELDKILKIYLAVTHTMIYDHDRTDNKELGSPLFTYPGDEIYKALRDRKSLCYGFAYVLRFALLQRGIDCFCEYGLCTAHGDGHEWVKFLYDGEWFNCDPAWDRVSDNYAKLVHFGKTDREREVDTLIPTDFASYHTAEYADLSCTDDRFFIFRDMTRFSYVTGHRFFMADRDNKEYIFDTEAFSFID